MTNKSWLITGYKTQLATDKQELDYFGSEIGNQLHVWRNECDVRCRTSNLVISARNRISRKADIISQGINLI